MHLLYLCDDVLFRFEFVVLWVSGFVGLCSCSVCVCGVCLCMFMCDCVSAGIVGLLVFAFRSNDLWVYIRGCLGVGVSVCSCFCVCVCVCVFASLRV